MNNDIAFWAAIKAIEALEKELSDDKQKLLYRPRFNAVTGNPLGSLFLLQCHYWTQKAGGAFYKFSAPCDHDLYKDGDSWQEELGFTRTQFETARDSVATKITKGVKYADVFIWKKDGELAPPQNLVAFWTDSERKTFYELNTLLFKGYLLKVYHPDFPNAGILHYLEMYESYITKEMQESRITYKESDTTPDTTPDIKDIANATPAGADLESKRLKGKRKKDTPPNSELPPQTDSDSPRFWATEQIAGAYPVTDSLFQEMVDPADPGKVTPAMRSALLDVLARNSHSLSILEKGVFGGQPGRDLALILGEYPDLTPMELFKMFQVYYADNPNIGFISSPAVINTKIALFRKGILKGRVALNTAGKPAHDVTAPPDLSLLLERKDSGIQYDIYHKSAIEKMTNCPERFRAGVLKRIEAGKLPTVANIQIWHEQYLQQIGGQNG